MKIKYFCLFLLIIHFKCDIKESPYIDKDKYPWIEIFTPKSYGYKKIKHNLDLGSYTFQFKSEYKNPKNFFKIVDSLAMLNSWNMFKISNHQKKYYKKSNIYEAANRYDIVILTYYKKTNYYVFLFETNKNLSFHHSNFNMQN
jgi:hypothetical protein